MDLHSVLFKKQTKKPTTRTKTALVSKPQKDVFQAVTTQD